VVKERVEVYRDQLKFEEMTINEKKSKCEQIDELKISEHIEIDFRSKISLEKQLEARLFNDMNEILDFKEINIEEEII
jgi:hypothetical protein